MACLCGSKSGRAGRVLCSACREREERAREEGRPDSCLLIHPICYACPPNMLIHHGRDRYAHPRQFVATHPL